VHRPWQEVDVQEGGLTPLLCGCLSLGPPSDLPIATLLQAFGAWETDPCAHLNRNLRFGNKALRDNML
jgi:hypothetical protein